MSGGRIEMTPLESLAELEGVFAGSRIGFVREPDRL